MRIKDIDWNDWDDEEFEPIKSKFLLFNLYNNNYMGYIMNNSSLYIYPWGKNSISLDVIRNSTKPITHIMIKENMKVDIDKLKELTNINEFITIGIDIPISTLCKNTKEYTMTENDLKDKCLI